MPAILIAVVIQAWPSMTPMPTPAYGFACGAVRNRIYVIGGRKFERGSIVPRCEVEAYDTDRDSWIGGFRPMPVVRWHAACAVLDDRIYVIGGTDGQTDYRRVDRFDPATNTWDTVASLPWGRQAAGACVFENQVHVVGGFRSGYYRKTVYRLVPNGGPGYWQAIDSLNSARSSVGVGVFNERIYALGGRYYDPMRTVEYYTPDQWTADTLQMVMRRAGLGVIACSTLLIAIGGDSSTPVWPAPPTPQSSVEAMDVRTGRWVLTEPMTDARSYMGAVRIGNRAYVIGGRGVNGTVLASVESHVLPLPGVGEQPPAGPIFRERLLPGVCRTLSIRRGGTVEVRDGAGRLRLRAEAPLSAGLPAGVYFVRFRDLLGSIETGRVLVVW